MNLPGHTGLEVLEALKLDSTFASTPVAILTSSTNPLDRKRAFDLGASDFLTKPVSLDEWDLLMERIIQVCTELSQKPLVNN